MTLIQGSMLWRGESSPLGCRRREQGCGVLSSADRWQDRRPVRDLQVTPSTIIPTRAHLVSLQSLPRKDTVLRHCSHLSFRAMLHGCCVLALAARSQDAPCAAQFPGTSKCQNSMINGAWNSTDTPVGIAAPTTQRGSALSFTYARSGALMARVGASGQSNQQANENPNDPIGEYFSAFDHADLCPQAVITAQSAVTGATNTYTSVMSGRLYLAIWRWNFFPQYANGSVTVIIDYMSPLQLAVSSSTINGSTAGSTSHPIVVQQAVNTGLPSTVTLNTASPGSITLSGYLPVVNLSLSTSTAWVNASGYTVQGGMNQVVWGNASAQNGGYPAPWLSWALPPSAALVSIPNGNGALGVDLVQMVSGQQFGFIFPATSTAMPLNPWWQQYYPPASNDYDNDYDTFINVIEGGIITLTAPSTDQWCGPTDWSASSQVLCVNGQGATQLSLPWNGCSGQFRSIYSNASQFGWTPNGNGYDNSGCNSDSDMQAPVNAVAFRIGQDSTSMQNAGYLNTEIHSNDYYYAFPNSASNGILSYTFTAAQSGRLYLARAGPGGGSASAWNGTIHVTAQYTPPLNIVFGLTWSPSPNAVSQPYLFSAPTSNSSAALAAAGLVSGRYLQIPDTFSGQTVTATFWVYQAVFSGTSSPGNGVGVRATVAWGGLWAVMMCVVIVVA